MLLCAHETSQVCRAWAHSGFPDASFTIEENGYEPNWKSLDSRPLPQWYTDAKVGIFVHWGVFSVPSFKGAWFWEWWKGENPRQDVVDFMKKNYKPDFTYADFAKQFTATFYNPDHWAEIFKASGAKYVVLTTKHHEGFCNWPSKYSWNWNSWDVGPHRDLVGDLAIALRKQDLRFGAYHSLFEFFNPLFLEDQKNKFKTQDFVQAKTMPELYELVNQYKPDIVWSDGVTIAEDIYWNSTNFLAWLYNDSPVKDFVVTNDRWGSNTKCKHGGYFTCGDHYNPKTLQSHYFEDSTTMARHGWSYRRDMKLSDVRTMEEVTTLIAQVVSCGGNLLINVGPTKDGVIVPILEERLRQMGQWLAVNGEGIYGTKPWTFQNETLNGDIWYTSKPAASVKEEEQATASLKDVYAILLKWPDDLTQPLVLGDPVPTDTTEVSLLGYDGPVFPWIHHVGSGLEISLPSIPAFAMPCQWAWTLKLTNIYN
ncbi:hypothetical protein RRG08_003005 [Elysia crispata]|uniref:alpha-L-fucosidase n=1 Tax=Elysia crispata TaxID=231223 RepID=A0AAE1B5J0_9GAST|nr:hypothetical protein RRG08_003005 [Elysia crispata]